MEYIKHSYYVIYISIGRWTAVILEKLNVHYVGLVSNTYIKNPFNTITGQGHSKVFMTGQAKLNLNTIINEWAADKIATTDIYILCIVA